MQPVSDPVERAHLKDTAGFSPPISRFDPAPTARGLVRRYWVPVWSLPDGLVSSQRVLPYPVCQLVVADDYAHLVGPRVGMSTKELSGTGWAFGAMLEPAAGSLLLGCPMATLIDRDIDLVAVTAIDSSLLIDAVRTLLRPDPAHPLAQATAAQTVEHALQPLQPVDDEGILINAVVALVESDPEITRVTDLTVHFGMTERSLQRLCAKRVGLSPKWLIQRRRLQDAAGRLAEVDRPALSDIAAELGYADQAHFTRDFHAVTGLTPSAYSSQRSLSP
ncbi:MAG: AraC family transcriptional regulator [Actinomycetales bacterium]|nr:MAG: AraC family transcriptional regulator [Actinomycetales bacterium]